MTMLHLLTLSLLAVQPPTTAQPIFDGATLAGWTTRGGRYDGPAPWIVEDGCLVGRTTAKSEGGLIYTERYHHGFELTFEVKMDYPFDSGVFVRMLPRSSGLKGLQVTLDHRPGGEIGAVYADGFLQHNEEGASHYKQGEWNAVRVRCSGRGHLEAWVNGIAVTDFDLPADAQGFAESGRIGLQVHGGEPNASTVRFRNITLRDLPAFDADQFAVDDTGRLTPKAKGWVDLLAGGGLDAWEPHGGDGEGFAVREGVLAALVKGGAHELRTKADFEDFELRFEFALAPMANSGVFLRADRANGNPAFSGAEVQLLDDWNWEARTKSKLKPWQFTGSLYGSVPPGMQGALNPLTAWNTLEIRWVGPRIRTRLNGFTLYDVDTTTLTPEQGEPFAKRAPRGFLGLQRHAPDGVEGDAYAWFRNVFVRRIEAR